MAISPHIQNILNTTSISDLIYHISNNTSSAIERIQKLFIPILYSQNTDTVLDFYTYDGITYIFDNELSPENKLSILFNNDISKNNIIKYSFYDKEEKEVRKLERDKLIRASYRDFISSDKIYNMMIFINNKLVKWSSMEVVMDYHYTYILIDGMNKNDVEDIKIIFLPSEMTYSENDSVAKTDKQVRFNSNGELDMESDDIVFTFTSEKLHLEYFNDTTILSNISNSKISEANIITFKDKLISNEVIKKVNYNEFIVDSGVESFIFYYEIDYDKIEHIDKVEDKEAARTLYKEASDDEQIKDIMNPLEIYYDYSFNKKEENEQRMIQDIVDYDRTLIDKFTESGVSNLYYTGLQIITSAVDGIYYISSPKKEYESGMLMFVNGELYSNYCDITYKHGRYSIPLTNINTTDKIEFLFFNKVVNCDYPIVSNVETFPISLDTENMNVLAQYVPGEGNRLWKTKDSDNLNNSRKFLYSDKYFYLINNKGIYQYENRGNTVEQITFRECENIIDAYIVNMDTIFVITKDNVVIKYDRNLVMRTKVYLGKDEKVTCIAYNNNHLYYSNNDAVKFLFNVDDNDGSEWSKGTLIKNKSVKFISFIEDTMITLNQPVKKYQIYDNKLYYLITNDSFLRSIDISNNKQIYEDIRIDDFFIIDNTLFYRDESTEDTYNKIYERVFDGTNFGEIKYVYNIFDNPIILCVNNRNRLFVYDNNNTDFITCINTKDYFSDLIWYKIPYNFSDGKITIEDKYLNRQLIVSSNNCFKHYHTTVDVIDTSGVILPKEFSYCKDWDHFMVFLNGKRLDQNSYAITTMKTTTPFIYTALFTSIPLELNDRVDVFYLPRNVADITKEASLSSSGYIEIPFNALPYGLNEHNCMIFLNGRKINYLETKDINFYKIKLNEDVKSLENLNIVQIIFDDKFSQLLQGATSEWDVILDSISSDKVNKLMKCKKVSSDKENSFKEYQATLKTPIYEIFYHYYLTDPESVSEIQLYDFMSADFVIDENDIMIPGVFDASLIDKFKPKKFNPLT